MKKILSLITAVGCGWHAAQAQLNYEPYLFTTLAGLAPGSADGTGSAARFRKPLAVAFDGAGNAFVADSNNTIRKVTASGLVTTFAGSPATYGSVDGNGSAARFYRPAGVAVDSVGNVYVTDDEADTVRKITPAGDVTTLAGLAGHSGSDDGTGTSARFLYPSGIAVDASGNVYVADSGNSTIRKITPAGVVSTFAGLAGNPGSADGAGSAARFNLPTGLTIDTSGSLFVCDSRNSTIRKITSAGVVTTIAGSAGLYGSTDGTGSGARFSVPRGIAVDGAGNLYVADTNNETIRKITPAAVVTTLAGSVFHYGSADGTGSSARFANPIGIAADPGGTVLVADYDNCTIRRITPAAVVSTLAGKASAGSADATGSDARFFGLGGVAVDTAGNIFVADTGNSTIRKVTPAGAVTTVAGSAGTAGSADGTGSAARFFGPEAITVDLSGNLYVADSGNHTIRKITPAGVVTTMAGSPGSIGSADGTGSAARFYRPLGIAVDASGYVYVADYGNNTIRKVAPGGNVSTVAGGVGLPGFADGAGASARFYRPNGLALDSAGNLFIADSYNNRIRKLTPDGSVSTVAGSVNGALDGAANNARFNTPGAVSVDSDGNLYVADSGNFLIRKITATGVVTTLAGTFQYDARDGVGIDARFAFPEGIAVDGQGNIFVADTENNTLRAGHPSFVQVLGAASRKMHGSFGEFDVDLPLGSGLGVECRSGGAAEEYEIVFTFAHAITFDDVLIDGVASVASVEFSSDRRKANIYLNGVSNKQLLTLTLRNVNDGWNVEDVALKIGILVGDTTGDGVVNSADIAQTKSQSGAGLTSGNFREDVTVDANINSADIARVKSKSGTALP